MKTAWLKGVEKDAVAEVKANFIQSLHTRRRLVTILQGKLEAKDVAGLSSEGYDCPNWALKQADSVGYRRAIAEIISILGD